MTSVTGGTKTSKRIDWVKVLRPTQGRIHGCWPKIRDARPIKSRFYQSQSAPKLAFWAQKSKKFGRGYSPLPRPLVRWRQGHPFPPLSAFGAYIVAPTALDSRLRHSTSASMAPRPQASPVIPLATPSGAAPVPPDTKWIISEMFSQPISWISTEKLKPTQEKQTCVRNKI